MLENLVEKKVAERLAQLECDKSYPEREYCLECKCSDQNISKDISFHPVVIKSPEQIVQDLDSDSDKVTDPKLGRSNNFELGSLNSKSNLEQLD